MKYLYTGLMLLLFAHFAQAQTPNYESLWEQVEKFEIEGLPKSALNVVEDITVLAKKEKNASQLIKTMLFKSKFALILEEDAQLSIVNNFKVEIAASTFPEKNILHSILAGLYWQYYIQNRWQFYNRTKTDKKVDAEDFRTWDLETLFNEIHQQYQLSLQNGLLLQLEPLQQYDTLLHTQKNSKTYRPTLFDFLNHEALNFYKTDETYLSKPAYKFEIDNPNFLYPAKTFSELKITSKDTSSLQLNALKIYQDLIQFHLKDHKPQALVDINIERLDFIQNHAIFNNADSTLLKTYNTEIDYLDNKETAALYQYEIASIYYRQAKTYQPKINEEYRWKAKEALEVCNGIISKFPESEASQKSTALKAQIELPSLGIMSEKHLPINQFGRLLITYNNIEQLSFSAYSISKSQLKKLSNIYQKEEQLGFIKTLKATTQWNATLHNENDYQTHTTEVAIPKLNNGFYIIFASLDSDTNVFAYTDIQITNIVMTDTNEANHTLFQAIDRNTGKPLANADIKLQFPNYDNKTEVRNFITDKNGEIKVEKKAYRYQNVSAKINYQNDIAYFGDYYISHHYNNPNKGINYQGFIFTDRSIYRPGQTVYFKAIILESEKGKSNVLPNAPLNVTLHDVNGQEVSTLQFKTNDFGSVTGEFILPKAGLTGQFHIKIQSNKHLVNTYQYFSVEEYKRPKFETQFTPITETFKINDSITIKGKAMAYAGSNITDAKVVYRVHRKVQYPHWYFWYRPWFNSEPQEITHGESTTNEKGEFDITFKALPDQSVDKSSLPIFNYEVTADVTDLNGETRSTTTIVNVGYHALVANITVDEKLDKTKNEHNIAIDTKNLNGEFIPAKGTVKIYKQKAPIDVLRIRPWKAPDYQSFSKEEFKNMFPHDAYANEDKSEYWEKDLLVFEKEFNTEKSKNIALGNIKKWESGLYLIVLESKDKFGQLVKDETKTILYSNEDKILADKQLFSITTNKANYSTNETAKITLASAAKELHVLVTVEKNNIVIRKETILLSNNKKTIEIPVTDSDYGGFTAKYSFAAFNSFYSGAVLVNVPYPKTDLEIETLTFRDKLQPNTDQTWSFKIKGPKGEQVSAELLASMYDASLNQFKPHDWHFNPIYKPTAYSYNNSKAYNSFGTNQFRVYNSPLNKTFTPQSYDRLNWFGLSFGYQNYFYGSKRLMQTSRIAVADNIDVEETVMAETEADVSFAHNPAMNKGNGNQVSAPTLSSPNLNSDSEENIDYSNIQIRKNLNETAFFFPQLHTNNEGHVSFSFTTPEALTQWKLQLLAHTKTLESATTTLTAVTQKELMVLPNAPRFLREGDQIIISSKISNLTTKQLSGQAVLILSDAVTGNPITSQLFKDSIKPEQSFTVNANGNTQISWTLSIPDNIRAIQYKIMAKAGNFSDGEQNALPVLSNRMLVTETLPMWVGSNKTRTFILDKLKTNNSKTLKNHTLTLEITSNPAWYAIQALPYLMEYPFECNEQTFSRYYANILASHIATSNPRIQEVFNQWASQDVLISNLEKNEALKNILIQETPWLRDAQSETEQKKRIALLFDLNKMNNELQGALQKLEQNQMSSGAWPWFRGGYESRFITQHIITGFGHLNKLGIKTSENKRMIKNAIDYLDSQFVKEYNDLKKYNRNIDLNKDHLSHSQLHYLYMRSFFMDIETSKNVKTIMTYYQTQIQKYWLNHSLYSKGLMALISYRNGDKATSNSILKSLKETSITSEELGMYWKENTNSWYWYQAPIETQALLIETFSEIENDTETIDNLKIWLLKNKQTNRWKTTKATTEAVYALLLQGSDWLSVTDAVNVLVGNKKIEPSKLENTKIEAGTGYYKTTWNTGEINPEMGEVTLSKKGNGIAWGGLYWQYFEDLDKITSAETPLKLKKKLFKKTNTNTGEEISEITPKTILKVGDLIRVRIELRSDRNMEFIHMKDMRAAGLEPVNVISQYKWQDGLGYYESTKDASTNFFFDYLPKGIYIFEYDLRVNNAGNMSNGITTVQSMYAPEFSSHSEGVRVVVKQ
ncbi:MAG: alpha-2-macroglobulin family protein [Aestuariibaculum sp.]